MIASITYILLSFKLFVGGDYWMNILYDKKLYILELNTSYSTLGVCLGEVMRIARIGAIRNSNVHLNNIFAIRNSENNCYSLFHGNVRITTIGKYE